MNVFLIVLIIVFAFFLLVLGSRLYVYVDFVDEFKFKLKFWFFTFESGNTKTKKKKFKKRKNEKNFRSDKKDREYLSHGKIGVDGFLNIFKGIFDYGMNLLKDLVKTIKIDFFSLNVKIASDDAAKTALNYGKACAIIYPIVAAVDKNNSNCIRQNVTVVPDFQSETGNVIFKMNFHAVAGSILWVAIKALWAFLKFYRKNINIKEFDQNGRK